jgi:hypothetical protein
MDTYDLRCGLIESSCERSKKFLNSEMGKNVSELGTLVMKKGSLYGFN